MQLHPLFSALAAFSRYTKTLIALALACGMAFGSAQAQTPAAPTPTTPPEGIRPPLPEPAPLPRFSIAPPPPSIAPAAPLSAPKMSPGTPRARPQVRDYCKDPAHQDMSLCKGKDAG